MQSIVKVATGTLYLYLSLGERASVEVPTISNPVVVYIKLTAPNKNEYFFNPASYDYSGSRLWKLGYQHRQIDLFENTASGVIYLSRPEYPEGIYQYEVYEIEAAGTYTGGTLLERGQFYVKEETTALSEVTHIAHEETTTDYVHQE